MFEHVKRAWFASIKAKEIHSLDGLRAISILLVLIGHASFLYQPSLSVLKAWAGHVQGTGVTFFFILSGFLITGLLIHEKTQNNSIDIKKFYFKRFFRIFPPYYFFLFVILGLVYFEVLTFPFRDFLPALTYTWNYLPTTTWYLGHTWSLSLEEQFYLIWPILFLFLSLNNLRKSAIILIFLTPVIRVAWYYLFPEERGLMSIMLHTRVDSLMFGCFLAYLSKENKIKSLFRYIEKYFGFVLSIIFLFFVSPILKDIFRGKYLMTVGYSAECVSICIIIISCLNMSQSNLIYKTLNSKLLRHIGILSYGLYLWQQVFLAKELEFGSFELIRFLYLYVVVLILFVFMEFPVMNLSKSIQKRWGQKE